MFEFVPPYSSKVDLWLHESYGYYGYDQELDDEICNEAHRMFPGASVVTVLYKDADINSLCFEFHTEEQMTFWLLEHS